MLKRRTCCPATLRRRWFGCRRQCNCPAPRVTGRTRLTLPRWCRPGGSTKLRMQYRLLCASCPNCRLAILPRACRPSIPAGSTPISTPCARPGCRSSGGSYRCSPTRTQGPLLYRGVESRIGGRAGTTTKPLPNRCQTTTKTLPLESGGWWHESRSTRLGITPIRTLRPSLGRSQMRPLLTKTAA